MRQHLQSKIFKKDSQQLAEQSDTGKMPKGGEKKKKSLARLQ